MAMPIFNYGKVKPLRQARGLNQAQIAAELGISRPTYVLIEQGGKEPTLTQLYTLARLLGVEAGELCADLPTGNAVPADYPKFKELVITCATLGSNNEITKTKLSLLAYLIDFAWHHQASRPLTGEVYRYMAKGPVADDFFRALDELYEAQSIALEPQGAALIIRTIEPRQVRMMSAEELALVNLVCLKWRDESTESIVSFVRQRLEPKTPVQGEPIPYESILTEQPSSLY